MAEDPECRVGSSGHFQVRLGALAANDQQISKELGTRLSTATVDHAVEHILQFPPCALLANVDVAHAFWNIPVYTDDWHLLSMQWDGEIFIDLTLPFGLKSSPKICTSVAGALEWIMLNCGVSWGIHYID